MNSSAPFQTKRSRHTLPTNPPVVAQTQIRRLFRMQLTRLFAAPFFIFVAIMPLTSVDADTAIHLAHGVTVTIPDEFAFNARLDDGTIQQKKPEPIPVDPQFPNLAGIRDQDRSARAVGPAMSDAAILLNTEYEDRGIRYDVRVHVVWLKDVVNLEKTKRDIVDEGVLAEFVKDQETNLSKLHNGSFFLDTITVSGWKTKGGYPVIDYQYHSKKNDLENFDTDYTYNRDLHIFRPDGVVLVEFELPVSRLNDWSGRLDAIADSVDVGEL
jgi:hypothetical protein